MEWVEEWQDEELGATAQDGGGLREATLTTLADRWLVTRQAVGTLLAYCHFGSGRAILSIPKTMTCVPWIM